ncbi:MAG TPA: DUF87 domain-containing protein [Syntrophobacteria bacterium]|nr:DUF87 domain-containing protein [Syntrophobacteria bacterium]
MGQTADFEKLGVFYLGRPYDLKTKKPREGLILYDSKDLVTHAVCVGMTGSGKTGLCIALLEEAAIDGIPAVVIDPKGDLGNLLLTFPELRAEDFAPWINEDEARTKGLAPQEYARQQAELWRKGLAAWGQDGGRIERLRQAADFAIYTPGSTAGLTVSILKSFARPPSGVGDDPELLREHIANTATSLLGLLGIQADPLRSREHILLATILDGVWKKGQDLDLAGLIQQIQSPPVSKVGVFGLESFYPSKDRFELVMALNNLLAAPGFSVWLEGEPLDIGHMLYTPQGKPRVAVFSIAHLGDPERMFFVSLLLNQVVGWMRNQSGTTSLRALVYMDEIFGYFPPVANPPSKQPLLTLLKQARAFGVGVVLATQNPVDLDYKGLANAGTWFIGRLQTERDKARVLDGLEGAAAGAEGRFDRGRMEETLAGLGNRVFLLNNVHEDAPEVFESRWTLSYLRGPLTRTQIKLLMDRAKASAAAPVQTVTAPTAKEPQAPPVSPAVRTKGDRQRPVIPPEVSQYFIPLRGARPEGATLLYRPLLVGSAQVRFTDPKRGIEVTQDVTSLTPVTTEAIPVTWEETRAVALSAADLEKEPAGEAEFGELPAVVGKSKSYETWKRDLVSWLQRHQVLEMFRSPTTKALSRPGESERDFRLRLQQGGREERDQTVARLRQKYAPKITALQERIRRAEQAVARESAQVSQQGIQTAISIGATLLGALMGRKAVSTSTLGRATTAMRGAGRVLREREDVGRAQENLAALQQQLADLEGEFKAEADAAAAANDPLTEALEPVAVRPTKQNISVRLVALAWAPWWKRGDGEPAPAWE